jgi:hypothetical protein
MADWNERRHILDYDSAVALRYHGRRKSFLDMCARIGPALSVIFGSGAFATIIVHDVFWAAVCALVVTIASALNLAFGIAERARLHESLFRRWGEIRVGLAALTENDDAELRKLEISRETLDAESPWQLLALSVLCENEEKDFRREGPLYKVEWLQRALANWLTLPGWKPVAD